MSREAYVRSVVPAALEQLGIQGYANSPGSWYFDMSDTWGLVLRDASPSIGVGGNFGKKKIDAANNLSAFKPVLPSLPAWLMLGAIREDDVPFDRGAMENTPQDETGGTFTRVFNHFFDPYKDNPLTLPWCNRAPDWVLTRTSSLTGLCGVNDFNVLSAREAMFRALTLKQFDTVTGALSDVPSSLIPEANRKAYWATMFRSLGDMVHLLQDMAQPQHTRGDAHAGLGCLGGVCLAGHESYYENYIEARATNRPSFTLRERFFQFNDPDDVPERVAANPLDFGNYPIPAFTTYRDYFSTAIGPASLNGLGLANYSNQGFYTAGTNLLSASGAAYPSPTQSPSLLVETTIPNGSVTDASGKTVTGALDLLVGRITDRLSPVDSADNVPLSARGMFDQFLKEKGRQQYILTHYNYDAQAALLIPRAVSYSAGLINYFFRGRVEISLPDEGVFGLVDHGTGEGFKKLRVAVRNSTEAVNDPIRGSTEQNMTGGKWMAVVKYHQDRRYKQDLSEGVGIDPCNDFSELIDPADPSESTFCRDGAEQIIVSKAKDDSLGAGAYKLMEFDFGENPVPLEATDMVLQIVYRGALGDEADAVAVGTSDISEATYFTYHNASDYIHIAGHVYTRDQVNNDPNLLAQVSPQSCVDYRLTPPRLLDACLRPFNIDIDLAFDDLTKPAVSVKDLPNRRYIRFAYLTVADYDQYKEVKAAKKRAKLKISVRRSTSRKKDLLLQDGTCVPHDPFSIIPRVAQLTYDGDGNTTYYWGNLWQLRGIYGWYQASCVWNGDNSTPGSPDDRNEIEDTLDRQADEGKPYAVTIMREYDGDAL
jgi:hypothetical protein